MVKTSTKQNPSTQQDQNDNEVIMNEELFYNSIRNDLDKLVKEPSEEVIQKILHFNAGL